MEACPPKLIEGVVGRLIPPARREDVLGDLRERYSSPGAYLNQALHVVPLVLFSQLRRTSDGLLMAWEAFILFLVLRGSPWSTWVQLTQLTLPIAAVVAALALRDAYTPPPVSAHPPDPEAAFDAALKRSVAAALMAVAACLPQAVLYVLDVGPSWLLPRPVLVRAVLGGFLMLVPLRVAWETQFRYGGYRRITQHGIQRETMTADAYRHALERRRDTLRRSWLWYLAFLVPVQVLFALPRSLVYARLWSTVFEATMTFVAVLLLWKLARRMADALQHEIDSLESP